MRAFDEMWDFYPKLKTLPASKKKRFFTVFGLSNPSAKAFFLSDFLRRNQPKNAFFCIERPAEIFEYQELFSFFLGEEYEIFSFSHTSDENEKMKERHAAIAKMISSQKTIFLFSSPQIFSEFPNKKEWEKRIFSVSVGKKISFSELFAHFSELGFASALDKENLETGEFFRAGDTLFVNSPGEKKLVRLETEFDKITGIFLDDIPQENFVFCPVQSQRTGEIFSFSSEKDVFFVEEFDDLEEEEQKKLEKTEGKIVDISAFARDEENSLHVRYLSLLKFYSLDDFLSDVREKTLAKWKLVLFSKRFEELKKIFTENHFAFSTNFSKDSALTLVAANENVEFVPPSFQNPEEKIAFLTDREIFHIKTNKKNVEKNESLSDFLTSLKAGDYVVHLDHGIGKFLGICEQEISGIRREYLEILYLQNDKLFVPIEHADKVSRYITDEEKEPRLTRLGGAEWKTIQKKAKKETEAIAKELLKLYAERSKAKAIACGEDTEDMKKFEEEFVYVPTPGQMAAIRDIKKDLQKETPMDRLLCGDVGFGKTEVAMRAAFKAVQSGMQVAVIAPITILVDQHFKSFSERMKNFGVNVEMLSRFRSPAEQKIILENLKKGKIDIIIGTHRLLSSDIGFHNLGLLIIDEEQRFGVKQKEKLKNFRKEVHILTMTATPIPRTLNLALHKLREISTITTPPPGRLPVLTEVRKYSDRLIRESILKEIARKGQVYFLHNRVETIEGITEKLRHLVPEAKFEVAHGQMNPHKLEQKIVDFKAKKFDVLVSSTIVENGIDLANANTMIINKAEAFGLSQLYQLRGRIGRSSKQAFAYLLYHSQKLSLDAKRRLRAIVEASELGSGFQLSMRDLEIRGAGDVLGVSQHGSVNAVGVNHFLRLLKITLADMEKGEAAKKDDEVLDVQMDIPLNAFVPSFYIADPKEKILAYQKLARVENLDDLAEVESDLAEEYGKMPVEVRNLVKVLEMKILAKQANISAVRFISDRVEFSLGKKVTAKEIMQLLKEQNFWAISGNTLHTAQKNLGLEPFLVVKEALKLLRKEE